VTQLWRKKYRLFIQCSSYFSQLGCVYLNWSVVVNSIICLVVWTLRRQWSPAHHVGTSKSTRWIRAKAKHKGKILNHYCGHILQFSVLQVTLHLYSTLLVLISESFCCMIDWFLRHVHAITAMWTEVHSAQSSLAVTHPSTNRGRRDLTSVNEPLS
jgi:hypothetical protein